jgi:hypothetical protein
MERRRENLLIEILDVFSKVWIGSAYASNLYIHGVPARPHISTYTRILLHALCSLPARLKAFSKTLASQAIFMICFPTLKEICKVLVTMNRLSSNLWLEAHMLWSGTNFGELVLHLKYFYLLSWLQDFL